MWCALAHLCYSARTTSEYLWAQIHVGAIKTLLQNTIIFGSSMNSALCTFQWTFNPIYFLLKEIVKNCRLPGRTMWTHTSFCRELIVLPGACDWSRDTYFRLLPIHNFLCFIIKILYQARFCLQISYPAILCTMLMGFLNCGSFVVHVLLPGTSKAFTLSVFTEL